MTVELKHVETAEVFQLTVIYAKCKANLRRPLWEVLRQKSLTCTIPWCVIGDFNVIASIEEKIRGLPYQLNLGFYGPRYTWSNGRGPGSIIWKRLDRGMVNDNWLISFPNTTISHLASTGSDHNLLIMEMNVRQDTSKKYFKFLNCWVENEGFIPMVQEIWNQEVRGNAMWIFHQKLKTVFNALSKWSRHEYGDIFQKAKEYAKKVKQVDMTWAQTNDADDRMNFHEVTTQYKKYRKLEESILKQKTQLQWFKDGDANSRYFHSLMRGRRRKLIIHKIKDIEGEWVQGDEAIGEAACGHLSFAYDIIIFTSGGRASLQKIMEILNNYEHTSGQQINRQKSHFMVSPLHSQLPSEEFSRSQASPRKNLPLPTWGVHYT
ncbi:PREDICTED: uncharacterized protein LOC109216799 [Nicotiana attenuata]|uniref:uncharacterized protein LOC109216799 n=1 Tax=Nicotiana attenuata TaxID=49451 RepID=UPI00090496F3|nr:PREDICTED: uncharacterized protein LOC109216799 [Nicotiana attenuata]